MQPFNSENNPSHARPTESEFVEQITDIFSNLRTYAYLNLGNPAEAIYTVGLPFTRNIRSTTRQLETAYYNAESFEALKDDTQAGELRKEMFAIALRAYVFSGARINPALIHMTADHMFVSQKEVRAAIRPNADFINRQFVHSKDKHRVRHLGYEALKQLGLVPFYGKRVMRLLDY